MSKFLVKIYALPLGTCLIFLCICEGLHMDNFDNMCQDQSVLLHSHICQKVTQLQGYGSFTLPGPLPHTYSAHLG